MFEHWVNVNGEIMTFVFTFDTWWRIVITDLQISSVCYKVFIRNVKRPAGFFRN